MIKENYSYFVEFHPFYGSPPISWKSPIQKTAHFLWNKNYFIKQVQQKDKPFLGRRQRGHAVKKGICTKEGLQKVKSCKIWTECQINHLLDIWGLHCQIRVSITIFWLVNIHLHPWKTFLFGFFRFFIVMKNLHALLPIDTLHLLDSIRPLYSLHNLHRWCSTLTCLMNF